MIRALRRVHRIVFVAAAGILPAILAAGLAVRRPVSFVAAPALPATTPISPVTSWPTTAGTIRLSLRLNQADTSQRHLLLEDIQQLRAPDVLLYWTGRAGPLSEVSVSDSLLGPTGGEPARLFLLPLQARDRHGSFFLYSLAHRAVIGSIGLPPAAGAGQ